MTTIPMPLQKQCVPKIGEPIRVSFTGGFRLPECNAVVTAAHGLVLTIRYADGHFAGLRGLLRLPG